ncbi:MAG: hypothetical protein U1E45_00110 [Geminicoccaceae bacterium]
MIRSLLPSLLAVTLCGAAAADTGERDLSRFIATTGPFCLDAPAARCVDKGFAFADTDKDGTLSLEEVTKLHAAVLGWYDDHAEKLAPMDRQAMAAGLLVVQILGPEQVFRGFDANGDGKVTKAELTADVTLDDRPLGIVLSDPKSIDWTSLADRAGSAAPLVKRLLGPLVPPA